MEISGFHTSVLLDEKLTKLHQQMADFHVFWAQAGAHLVGLVGENIEQRGALSGDAWPPLAHATLAARARKGQGRKPLQATGALAGGFTSLPGPQKLVMDNPIPYAARHQRGEGVPKRAFLPGPEQVEKIITPLLEKHIQGLLL